MRTKWLLALLLLLSGCDQPADPGQGFAGLGGDVRYIRFRGRGQQFWNVGNSGFIFSILAEGGTIIPLQERTGAGVDDVLLTDRFFLGEPQFRGFAIRGVGPRILTQTSQLDGTGRPILDANGNITTPDGNRVTYVPEWVTNLSLEYKTGKLRTAISLHHTGEQYTDVQNTKPITESMLCGRRSWGK